MALVLDNADLNGECYVLGSEGEREELIDVNRVPFRAEDPSAQNPRAPVPFTAGQSQEFVMLQFAWLKRVRPQMPNDHAAIIAYLRFLAAREGLVSPQFVPNNHFVTYNDAFRLTAQNANAIRDWLAHADNAAAVQAAVATLAPAVRKTLREVFTDTVCLVAFMFRVRGHHFLVEMGERYAEIWTKMRHTPAQLPAPWELVATAGLHAIFPDVLDDFWLDAVENSRCDGAIAKRYNSAPAGYAGIGAIRRGLDDVLTVFPDIAKPVPDAIAYLDELIREAGRWTFSVNHRFYGVPRTRIDEGKLAVLAALVKGVYDQLAQTSPLGRSPALTRVAGNAPVLQGAIGRIAARTVADERMKIATALIAQ